MNKTTKGSLAAGAAAVLLLGGAGSLAYWTDSATVEGGEINSGLLTLDDGVCDGDWLYAPGSAGAGNVVVNFVPGDIVTKDCDFVVGAVGDNLTAAPTVPSTLTFTTDTAPNTFTATVAATYTLAGAPFTDTDVITEDNDGDALVASILVTIPFGNTTTINTNNTQNMEATLADLTVALTQTES